MDYYKVHCAHCGEVFDADKMAVNIDELVRRHLDKFSRRSSDLFYQKAKEIFDEIKIGMYLTKYELVNLRYLDIENQLELTVDDILHFVEEKIQMTLPEHFPQNIRKSQEKDTFWDEVTKSEEKDEKEIDINPILDTLSFKLSFYNQSDADERGKREKIEEFLRLFLENRNKVVLECTCLFTTQHDDRDRAYLSALEVTYVDGEHKNYNNMICPFCGEKLMADAGKYEEKIIVMLGSSRVGKTAYLAALVDKHVNMKNEKFDSTIGMESVTGAQFADFQKNILDPYSRGEKIIKTDVSKDKVSLFPMLITMNHRTVNYIFVDLPGEVFVPSSEQEMEEGAASGDFIANHKRICKSADAFWFCIDPVQVDCRLVGINEKLEKADRVEMDLNMVLANIANIVSTMGAEKSKIPTAIVLTKSDLVERSEGLYSETEDVGVNCLKDTDQFRADIAEGISNRVKEYLMSSNMVIDIVSRLDRMFASKSYFSVAAYGKTVTGEMQGSSKAPYGVDLPFLWTVACMGLLQPVKLVQKIERSGFLGRTTNVREDFETADDGELFI